ncbi:uroporphyrinogen-III C-methyltransferase [Paraoerskovia marina]|uniref:Uroporphyrinogen-III C-methyltransferase n=1 Tax=Paraoerskovia marina TaxID=545619 RepID=A0A1H1V2J8_9CELL|nr:uroporphyrinogen-III C-methyltransferase [Paraoerskovia marina]SDS78998.1 uroporphyrinogen-III C-methyltransferase [Paraoerskovia marina]
MSADIYPLGLRITGRPVVVVGGGPVAARRAAALVEAGAHVTVVAPWICEDVADAVDAGDVRWVRRDYLSGDLDGAWLVHVATGDPSVDAEVARDAEQDRVFCVTAGDADLATAHVPAVARTALDGGGQATISVHAHRDPRRAVRIRDAVAGALQSGALPLRRVRARDETRAGRVALVGGGPGATGLITARGRTLLAQADVVVIDRLAPRALLEELADDVVVVDVGKTPGNHPVPQAEINALIVQHALAGHDVVRLKGGDPYVFGRGGEEREACEEHGLDVEVVPGVTSAVSVPAAAGIPVTHRGLARGFTVLTGHEDISVVPARSDHTVVLLMGVSRLRESAGRLVDAGRDASTPVAIVEDGYGARQRVTVGTLATIADRAAAVGVRSPAVTVVGDVVRLAPAWTMAGDGATVSEPVG